MMVFIARSSDRRQDRSKWHMRAFGLTVPQSVLAQADDGTEGRCCRACPMVAQGLNPKRRAPGKLAKDRSCKSSTR
jgi:hypothetical protein